LEEPGTDEGRGLSRDDGPDDRQHNASDAGGEHVDADGIDHADRVEHVEVRRARPPAPATVFGDTPIAGPPRPQPPEDPDQPGETQDLGAWVRHAAMVAALRSGAQACVAGIFMGVVLGFFLSGLISSAALLIGLILCIGSVPVSILAGFATYRQTLETERQRQGLCPRCGYDLRGLVTARCPECGAKLRPPRAWQTESDKPADEEDGE
jgi:hypothetical protein